MSWLVRWIMMPYFIGYLIKAFAQYIIDEVVTNRNPEPDPLPPSDLIKEAWRTILLSLEPLGFQQAGRDKRAIKHQGELEFEIWCASDRKHNWRGRHAIFHLGATVRSPGFAQWLQSHPNPIIRSEKSEGEIVYTVVETIIDPPIWMTWDVARASKRVGRIEDAKRAIHRYVLPGFDRADGSMVWLKRAMKKRIALPEPLIQYALFRFGKIHSAYLVDYYLKLCPEIKKYFIYSCNMYKNGEFNPMPGDLTARLAILCETEDLPIQLRYKYESLK